MFRIVLLVLCSGFILLSCEKEENKQKIIINGILRANQQPRIKVCMLSGSEFPYEHPVSGAIVSIENRGVIYWFDELENENGIYTDKSNSLEILTNESYILSVVYGNIQAHAETIVPEKPEGLNAVFENVELPFRFNFFLTISWKKQTEYSFITINSASTEDSLKINDSENTTDYVPFYLEKPYQLESAVLSLSDFKYYGTNIIKVYSINEEYQQLYTYRREYKVDNPPIETNIINGLGIFTGMSYDSIVVDVAKP